MMKMIKDHLLKQKLDPFSVQVYVFFFIYLTLLNDLLQNTEILYYYFNC